MHEQVRARRRLGTEAAAEGEDRLDIAAMRSNQIGRFLNHIIETQFDALVLAERPEDGQFRLFGVEYRQDVAYADIAVVAEFVDAANRVIAQPGGSECAW